MLDIKRIRDNPDEVRDGLTARGADPAVVDSVLECDARRRASLGEVEALKATRKAVSKEFGKRKAAGEDMESVQAEMRELGDRVAVMDEDIRKIDDELTALVLGIPNLPHVSTPRGLTEDANEVVRTVGELPHFDFEPKAHIELCEELGILDLKRAARMSGAGFPLFVGQGARLVRALKNFMLDMHVEQHGYTEVTPPFLCAGHSMTGTGQLPKMADDMYRVEGEDLYLIPTAEVPVTNIYREEIMEDPLPKYLTAYTPCFRREAGAAGKDTRGIIRVHQFDKVEMVKFVEPETSYEEFESLVGHAEDVLKALNLPYRVLSLCSGDISFAAAKCFDLELWAPGQNGWLEVSSCSNFEDFQARRAGIRYRNSAGKVDFVHTLNGSGVALPRIIVALLEMGQQADGSVVLPDALVPYMGGVSTITGA